MQVKALPAGQHVPMTPQSTPSAGNASQQARARAIAMLSPQQAAANPVPNPSNVTPEELTAVRPSSQASDVVDEKSYSGETDQQSQDDSSLEVEATPPPPKKDEQLSSQYAMLAKREKQLRMKAQQQEQTIKAREDAIRQREEAISAKDREYSQGYISKADLKQNPLKIFADAGLSYDEVTQAILNQGSVDPRTEAYIQRLESKLSQFEEKMSQNEKNAQNQQQQAYDAALSQIKTDVKSLVYTDPSFETIKATNSVNDVVELIKKTYDEDGILLSVEDAANEVENYLVDEALKLARLSKIQKRMQPVASKPVQTQGSQTATSTNKQQQPMKTLTNAASTGRKLSPKERAILAFKGELKSWRDHKTKIVPDQV